jgi:predicted Zn-dependent protease
MNETLANIFDESLERYKAGEAPETLIPVFKDICDRAPKNATALSCLAWLYLLTDKPDRALRAAQKSVKLDPRMPQARINLALAILDSGSTGVREHVEFVSELIKMEPGIGKDIFENIEDGLTRKPDWDSLLRIKKWLS